MHKTKKQKICTFIDNEDEVSRDSDEDEDKKIQKSE